MGFMSDFWAGTEAQRNLRDMAQENIQRANVEYASLNKQLQSATDEQTRKDILSKMDGVQAKIAGNTPMATQALGFSGSLLNNLASSPEAIKNSFNALSDSFAQGINNFFNRQNTDRVSPNGASDHLRNQATMHEQQSGDLQKAQQQSQQIANRDYHTEADKNAVAGAATENAQRVQNLSASAGAGAAALNRQVKSSDYNTTMNRQDTQRDKAVERGKEAWDVRQQAERERAAADNSDYMGYLAATENQESNTLSKASNKTADNTNSIPYVYSSKDTLPKNTEPSEPTDNAQTGNAPAGNEQVVTSNEDNATAVGTDTPASTQSIRKEQGTTAMTPTGGIDNSKVDFSVNSNYVDNGKTVTRTPSHFRPVKDDSTGIPVEYDATTKRLLGDDNLLAGIDAKIAKSHPGVTSFSEYMKSANHPYATIDDLRRYMSTLPKEDDGLEIINSPLAQKYITDGVNRRF